VSDLDALQDEMRRLPLGELGADPLALDWDTADRLLAGRLEPPDAPPGYAEVAMALSAAAGPPTPGELAGEAAAIATFAAMQRSSAASRRRTAGRRRASGSRLVALATMALCVLLIGGVAAAATGTLPAPARWVVDSVSRAAHHFPARSVGERQDQGTVRSGEKGQDGAVIVGHIGSGQGAHVDQSAPTTPTGPGATGAARGRQCAPHLAARAGVNGCKKEKAKPERQGTQPPRGAQSQSPQTQDVQGQDLLSTQSQSSPRSQASQDDEKVMSRAKPAQPLPSAESTDHRQRESGRPGPAGTRR